jgi:predicted phage baseplate assembly protein
LGAKLQPGVGGAHRHADAVPVFVVEVEEDGSAYLRFGDGEYHGQRPESTTRFTATYRIGNGARGNIGAESLAHVVDGDPAVDPAVAAIERVRNPLPARGGVEPERLEDVRQRAPAAFRTQQRAVTPDDYATAAQRHPQVRRAAASFRWTGSWRTVFLVVERMGGLPVDAAFKEELRRYMEPYRLAGHDLEIDTPHYVALEIKMGVNVKPDYFRSEVRQALFELFSNRLLPDGRRGVFHPDNFGFGQPVYLSPLYAAAQAVAGIDSVDIKKFQRQGVDSQQALNDGKLMLDRLEIARLDNDLDFPEHGVLRLTLEGGK